MISFLLRNFAVLALLGVASSGWALNPGGARFETVLVPEDQTMDCGRKGSIHRITQTVNLATAKDLRDVAIPPLRPGETVQFAFHNATGASDQVALIGSAAELKQFAIRMNERGYHRYRAPNLVHLRPGETGVLIWTFSPMTDCRVEVRSQAPMELWRSQGSLPLTPLQP